MPLILPQDQDHNLIPGDMATMLASRDNMAQFNSLDLDEVHTPARYFALNFFIMLTGVFGHIVS